MSDSARARRAHKHELLQEIGMIFVLDIDVELKTNSSCLNGYYWFIVIAIYVKC